MGALPDRSGGDMSSDATKRFGERLLAIYTGAVLTKLIEIGYQVGLFEGSRAGPATSAELADRLRLKERYVREWLGAMAVSGFIGAVKGLPDQLRKGIRVLDIGCGTGHAMNVLAREFPSSMFTGYDIAEDAIALAREEANELALSNSTFSVVDVTDIPDDPKFNLITAFDAIHDQKAPDAVLRSANRALATGGTFLMIDFKFSSRVEENIGNPFAPMYYGISLMHCMPVSLAVGGQGLGTVWGEQTARRMLAEAGFGNVVVLDTPRPQNYMFVASH